MAGCQKAAAPPPPVVSAADQAMADTDHIALLVKDVTTSDYENGAPSQCTITFNIYNNTKEHLDKAAISIADYPFNIEDLTANSHFRDDDTGTVDPINGSCAGVADKLLQQGPSVATTDCTLEGLSEGDCQQKVAGFVAFDKSIDLKIQQAEHVASQNYAAQQAALFQQQKAQAWADRGKFEASVGSAFIAADPGSPPQLAVVTAPDFDPTKLQPDTQIATSSQPLCQALGADGTDGAPGRLVVAQVIPDQYGLADWYKFRLVCGGSATQVVWMKSGAFNDLQSGGQITRQGA